MEGTSHNNENRIQAAPSERGLDASLVFGGDTHRAFIFKKTEKLVTAVYMITDFIKDTDPLKGKIRDAALSLLELNLDWGIVPPSERRELVKEYKSLALEIVSFSNVACYSGLISEMNFSILSREFNSLLSSFEKNGEAGGQPLILDPGFFSVPEPEPSRPQASSASDSAKGHSSRTLSVPQEAPRPSKKPEYLPVKDIETKSYKPVESKDNRQATIIKLLSKKSGLSIKDFAESIKGVSEKTIQRELLAMVAAGVLKKEGERRWSTYSLASNLLK